MAQKHLIASQLHVPHMMVPFPSVRGCAQNPRASSRTLKFVGFIARGCFFSSACGFILCVVRVLASLAGKQQPVQPQCKLEHQQVLLL